MMTRPRHIPPELRSGSEEQAAVIRVLRSTGWTVYSTSDPRVRRATKGIVDLIAFKPGRVLFWDSKAGKGAPTPEQREFLAAAGRAGAEIGWGDAEICQAYQATIVAPREVFP
jgi:hypothetical protein